MKIHTFFILMLILLLWAIMPVSAIIVSDATIELEDDNSGIITVAYKLSDHENEILSTECVETLDLAKEFLGLTNDGSGAYSFTEENMTQYADMNGQPVLLLHGFYFDWFDWRTNNTLVAEYPRLALLGPVKN